MNRKEKLMVGCLGIILISMLGCSGFQDALVLAYIDEEAIEYAREEDGKEFTPYTSLWDLQRIDRKVDRRYKQDQLLLRRQLEDINIKYVSLKDVLREGAVGGAELKNIFFGTTGVVNGLIALSGLGIGTLALSKPGDKKKIKELENGKIV